MGTTLHVQHDLGLLWSTERAKLWFQQWAHIGTFAMALVCCGPQNGQTQRLDYSPRAGLTHFHFLLDPSKLPHWPSDQESVELVPATGTTLHIKHNLGLLWSTEWAKLWFQQ